MKAFLKRWGLHHGIVTLLAFPFVGWFIVVFYCGKEFGEAIERAGGTRQALKKWKWFDDWDDEFKPVWEPFDALTPIGVGLVFTVTEFLGLI